MQSRLLSFPQTEKWSVPSAADPGLYLGTGTSTKRTGRSSPEDFISICFKIFFARQNENSVSRLANDAT